MIVDLLIHLCRDRSFSLSALNGYRAAISSVLSLKGVDLANSQELTMLFRSFSKSCSSTDLLPPAWDIALVLQSLTVAPYEPLRDADERYPAHKTLFLVALASAKRVGELHALSHSVSHSMGWKEVSFGFVPGFMIKTGEGSGASSTAPLTTKPKVTSSRAASLMEVGLYEGIGIGAVESGGVLRKGRQ